MFYPLKIFPLPCTSANSWPVLAGEGKRLYHKNMKIISPNYLPRPRGLDSGGARGHATACTGRAPPRSALCVRWSVGGVERDGATNAQSTRGQARGGVPAAPARMWKGEMGTSPCGIISCEGSTIPESVRA